MGCIPGCCKALHASLPVWLWLSKMPKAALKDSEFMAAESATRRSLVQAISKISDSHQDW